MSKLTQLRQSSNCCESHSLDLGSSTSHQLFQKIKHIIHGEDTNISSVCPLCLVKELAKSETPAAESKPSSNLIPSAELSLLYPIGVSLVQIPTPR